MLKIVVKRDGREEEFSADKINDWARWGEKTINSKGFNWSSIVLKTVAHCPEKITASELQQKLIKECLDYDSWESNRMAGRLYASALPKDLYETRKHPHIRDLHNQLIELGIVVKPNYTDEEYDEINKMLNHKRDYAYTHYSINQLVKKYSLQNRVTKTPFETPQFIYMRVAMQTFNNYHKEDRLQKLNDLYQELSHQRINVPTPYFANSLTSNPSTSSCSVLTCTDEAESIGVLNTLAYTLTTAGAGVGAHMKTRSIGDAVRGGLVKHAGKVPYYRAFANVMKSSTQGCYDPETEVYTKDGWVFFKDITDNTLVAQVHEDSSVSYTKPLEIFKYQHNGDMFHFFGKGVDLYVTPNHRMILSVDGKFKECTAEELYDNSKEGFIPSFQTDGDISDKVSFVCSSSYYNSRVFTNQSLEVFCVEVETGMLLVRRNGCRMICGNSRSGASTMHFPVFDPEIEVLAGLKNPLSTLANRVRESDYAVSINKPFLRRALTKKPFWLFSYKDNPELYEKFYHADSDTFDRELEEFARECPDKVREIDASSLLTLILEHRVETGRLYIHFVDIANHQTPFKDSIYSSNLCIAGNQLVPSNKGLLTAEELNELNVPLTLVDGKTKIKSSPMKLREISQDVYKITLKNGMSHTVTGYHKIMTNKGLVQCKDLVVGKHKAKINVEEGIFGTRDMVDEAYLLGLWQGDGTSSKESIHIDVWEDKTECLKDEILEIYSRIRAKYTNNEYYIVDQDGKSVGKKQYSPGKFTLCTQVGSKAKWRLSSTILKKYLNFEKNIIPRWLRESNRETQLAYVKGLFQTDGTYNYSCNAHYLSITQTSKEYLEELQILLNNLGYSFSLHINSEGGLQLLPDSQRNLKEYECKPSYRLVSDSFHTCLKFEEDTGFITFRGKTLPEPVKKIHRPEEFIDIVSVEYAGKENVYCPTVDSEEHLFVSNCFITRNCMEISLITKPFRNHLDLYSDDPEGLVAFCNLAGLNIPHIKNDEEYEKSAYYALLMIEQGISNSYFAFPALNANLKDYRSAGVGIVGLAYLMAKKGMSYTTQEGRDFIFEQAEKYGYFVTKAAVKLTEEFGLSKKSHESKYADGWLPMDSASPHALSLTTKSLQYDWEELRAKIKELGGIRYSTLFAIAPSESCMASSTKIQTDQGVLSLKEILEGYTGYSLEEVINNHNPLEGGSWYPLNRELKAKAPDGSYQNIPRVWFNGVTPTFDISLEDGSVVRVTANHKFLVGKEDGTTEWKPAFDLKEGDDILEIE